MRGTGALLVGALMASAVVAGWKAESGSSTGDIRDVSCCTINGQLGLLIDWSHTKTEYSITSEPGEFGVLWWGWYYPLCIGLSDQTVATVTHSYRYAFSGRPKIRVRLTTATNASGAATQADTEDQEWWWDPAVNIQDTQPTVKRYDSNHNLLQEYGYAQTADGYDHINVRSSGAGTQQNPAQHLGTYYANAVPNPGGYASGSFDGTTGTITGDTGQTVEVEYQVNGSASSNCDNASVWYWRVWLQSTLISEAVN